MTRIAQRSFNGKSIHKSLAAGRWFSLSLCEQMANIGSEIERTIKWRNAGNAEYMRLAFDRALELIDCTANDIKNRKRLKEVLRSREALVDYFIYDNVYKSTDSKWRKYFYSFNYAASLRKGR